MALRCSRGILAFLRPVRPVCGALNTRFFTLHHHSHNLTKKIITQCPNLVVRFLSSLPKHIVIKLPNLSPTMETGTIVSWAKNVGDEVSEGDLLAEIETDKATMSFDASEAGYLAKILAPSGTKDIPVGTTLCILVEDSSSIPAFADYVPEAVSGPTKTEPKPTTPPPAAAAVSAPSAPPPPPQSTATAPTITPAAQPSVARPEGQRIFASPLARRLAAEQGINLAQLSGSGVSGMIRSSDLAGAKGGFVAAPAMGGFADLSVGELRSAVGKRLLESKRTVPHYYLTSDIQIDELLQIRSTINDTLAKASNPKSDAPVPKITLNDILIKAVAVTCLKVPECNSAWHGDFIRQYHTVNVNFAVATSAGLINPVIYSVETKGLMQISNEVRTLAAKAKENQLQPQELQDGTFTISNLGMFGINCFSATINPPQACTLAIGGPLPRLVPDDLSSFGFKKTNYMSVTLSCDHRVVDGAVGAAWLAEFKKALEHPALLLM